MKALFFIVASLFAISVNAATVTHLGYTLDTDTNIVRSPTGAQWLRWDQTLGLSINKALERNPGWHLATPGEFAYLFNNFLQQRRIFPSNTETYRFLHFSNYGGEFIELFGTNKFSSSIARIGDASGYQTGAVSLNRFPERFPGDGVFRYLNDEPDLYNCDPLRSVALVKYDIPPPPVPEPATWLLFGAGIGLIGFATKRRKKN